MPRVRAWLDTAPPFAGALVVAALSVAMGAAVGLLLAWVTR
ncbi:MAG: hypothetical protein Q8P50_15200 [Bacillota bacterium]|nr:hypothetical protein [Bacillota bacterium]